ncbi:MAG: FHA domain-containing protein [Bdellovibrionales bacterium]|nr:FHA domain-containing protein [Bdellovibrionales bacterium]
MKISIGRKPTNNFYIAHSSVSRDHAEIVIENKKMSFVDLKSLNGCHILKNGQWSKWQAPVMVLASDYVLIGHCGPYLVQEILSGVQAAENFGAEVRMDPDLLRSLDPDRTKFTDEIETAENAAARLVVEKRKFRCNSCGSIITVGAKSCPHCLEVF